MLQTPERARLEINAGHTAPGWCPTAVSGGSGGAWPGFKTTPITHQHTRHRRCGERRVSCGTRETWLWGLAAGPGWDVYSNEKPHLCGGCRRVGGLGRASRSTTPSRRLAHRGHREACGAWPRCRRVGGPGRASRSTTPSRRLTCGDLAGGPPPTGTHTPAATTSTHNDTRPRPVSRPRPRRAQSTPLRTTALRRSTPLNKAAPPAIRRSCPRGPRPRRGRPRGGRRGRGRGSKTRSRHPRCGRSGSTAGRHRAHHTRRA